MADVRACNRFDPRDIPDEFHLWSDKVLDGNYVRVSQTLYVEHFIDSYDNPVLIAVGTGDNPELVESTAFAARRYVNESRSYRITPEALYPEVLYVQALQLPCFCWPLSYWLQRRSGQR